MNQETKIKHPRFLQAMLVLQEVGNFLYSCPLEILWSKKKPLHFFCLELLPGFSVLLLEMR
jgi:hypothetical protein